jgi:hypothetical protein
MSHSHGSMPPSFQDKHKECANCNIKLEKKDKHFHYYPGRPGTYRNYICTLCYYKYIHNDIVEHSMNFCSMCKLNGGNNFFRYFISYSEAEEIVYEFMICQLCFCKRVGIDNI